MACVGPARLGSHLVYIIVDLNIHMLTDLFGYNIIYLVLDYVSMNMLACII